MQTHDWKQIESILDEALTLPEKKQQSFIKLACDGDTDLYEQVLELLKAIRSSGETHFLQKSFAENRAIIEDLTKEKSKNSFIGRQIGVFELTEKIGSGGMGGVFRAARTDGQFNQEVAIKLIRTEFHSEEIFRRFELEKKILAGLSHPNIARLYDGGVTKDGHPYFIMEYIDGMPIDAYCNHHKLTIHERLSLFKEICKAVAFAHQNLTIHRDLKTQNIYVTKEGLVKILDFGIAKILDAEKIPEEPIEKNVDQQFWTAQYAAPEQVNGKSCTTAIDVYALGVLLYKILTDTYPLQLKDKSRTEVKQIVTHEAPAAPSTFLKQANDAERTATLRKTTRIELKNQLTGDIDTLVLKALHKEPEHRYTSVGQLLEDIERYEKALPLLARKDTIPYRTGKFMRRHKTGLVFTVSLLLMLSLFAAIYTFNIENERAQAQAEADKAEMVSSFLIGLFEASDPTEARGDTVTARELLHRGLERAEALKNQKEVQSQMFETIGRVYRRLGQYQQSQELLNRALENRQNSYGTNHIETASSLDHLGMLLSDQGSYTEAESLLRQSLQIRQNIQEAGNPALAQTMNHLAYALRKQGHYGAAENLYRSSLNIRMQHFGNDHPLTVASMSSLGTTLHNKGDYKATEKLYREVLVRNRLLLKPDHPNVAMNLNNLGALLMNIGQFQEAAGLLNEALEIRQKVYGYSHPKVALTMNNLAMALRDVEEYDNAEPLFRKALVMRIQLLGDDHVATAISRFGLARLMLCTNRPDSALAFYRQALDTFSEKLSEKHSFTIRTKMSIGSTMLALGRTKEARYLLEEGFKQIEEIHADSTLEKALAERELGVFYYRQGKFDKADSLLSDAYYTLINIEGKSSPRQREIAGHIRQLRDQQIAEK